MPRTRRQYFRKARGSVKTRGGRQPSIINHLRVTSVFFMGAIAWRRGPGWDGGAHATFGMVNMGSGFFPACLSHNLAIMLSGKTSDRSAVQRLRNILRSDIEFGWHEEPKGCIEIQVTSIQWDLQEGEIRIEAAEVTKQMGF